MINYLYNYFNTNTLFKNSVFLLASNIIASIFGFLFWILIARLYSTAQIGIATSLSSLINLIATFSLIGLNTGILRFLPMSKENNKQINSTLIIIIFISGISALATLFNISTFSPHLHFIVDNYVYSICFIIATILIAINSINDSIFLAYRATIHIFIKTMIQNILKLLFPFSVLFMGTFGIISSLYVGVLISALYGYGVLYSRYNLHFQFQLHGGVIKKMASFSLGTYLAGLASSVPSYILPMIIINRLSPSETAYYYIAATTVNVLYMIPQAITQNLLVEGSYDEDAIKLNTRKASRLILIMLLPSIALMLLFGNDILLVFGKQYSSSGFNLLKLLSLSGIFVGINYVLGTLLILYKHLILLIGINLFSSVIIIITSVYFLHLGITGIGIATLLTQSLLTFIYILSFIYIKKSFLLRHLF